MKVNRIVFIGPCGGGQMPKDGASGKNYHFINYLKTIRNDIKVIDTAYWKKRPYILIKLLWTVLLNRQAKYILATDNLSSYRVISFFSLLPIHRYLIYWMIGGSMPLWIKEGKVKKSPFNAVDWFVVEGCKMIETMEENGFKGNVIYVPNFKFIKELPPKSEHSHHPIRFVFLSRIIPEKGCITILDSIKILSNKCGGLFTVDFYGPIEESFQIEFKKRIEDFNMVQYKGFLDLSDNKNYEVLEKYDVMLFPTYWHGEGFPGIIVDAYISGLPIIATDWSLNSEIINEGETGFIIPPQNVEALAEKMYDIINNPKVLKTMSENCRSKVQSYNIKNVITEDLLSTLGL